MDMLLVRPYMTILFASLAGLLLAGCVSTGGGDEVRLGEDLRKARGMAEQCREELKSVRENNDLLIETNARLTSQLQAGKLDTLAKGADLGERLSECEFRTRELEESVMEKETQIGNLELEVEKYSSELRDLLEERQTEAEERQREQEAVAAVPADVELIYDEFAVEFEEELTEGGVSLIQEGNRVFFTIWNRLLFRPGKVKATKNGRAVLKRVSAALKSIDDFGAWEIEVAGHTDSLPPGKSMARLYPTNWEMSQARAVNVLHYFADKGGIPPAALSAVGYGHQRPIASNDTREGRAQNLRVVIALEHKGSGDAQQD
jgi:chemotaxis protein MotB